MTGIIGDMFRAQKSLKGTRMKLCNALGLPAVLYGDEYWTVNL